MIKFIDTMTACILFALLALVACAAGAQLAYSCR
jgi:hypothetical protein